MRWFHAKTLSTQRGWRFDYVFGCCFHNSKFKIENFLRDFRDFVVNPPRARSGGVNPAAMHRVIDWSVDDPQDVIPFDDPGAEVGFEFDVAIEPDP